MLLCMIDAIEVWEVATNNITEALLQTDYDKGDIYIKLEWVIYTLLKEIDPGYYQCFIYTDKHRMNCMYAESNNSIYAIL